MFEVPCDICSSGSHELLSRIHGNSFVRCSDCGHFYMRYRCSVEELHRIYSNDYFTTKYIQGNEKVNRAYLDDKENILRFVRKRFDTLHTYKTAGTLLDVGCAYGFYLEYARECGWEIYGIDVLEDAVGYCRRTLDTDTITRGFIEDARYAPCSFDVVTMWLVFEHTVDPNRALVNIRTWLRDDGIIGIKVPHIGGITYRLSPGKWYEQHPEDHFCDYTVATLTRLLGNHGFRVLEHETEGIYLDRALSLLALDPPIAATDELSVLYQELAKKLDLGDSLVLWAQKTAN